MNKAIISGFITRQELTYTQHNNTALCKFSVAVRRKYTSEGQPDTDFINCVAWKKTAEFMDKYFGKGAGVIVEGNIQTRNYEGKNGKVYMTEIIVDSVDFPPVKKSEQKREEKKQEDFDLPDMDDDYGDGLPF